MNKPTLSHGYDRKNLIVILTIGFSLIAGGSFLVLPTPYAPLAVVVGLVGFIVVFRLLGEPVWALYFAIFVVLLPTSLIPAETNSILNRLATILAFAVWVIDLIGQKRKIVFNLSTTLLFFFIIWSAVTLTWSVDRISGAEVLQTYILRLVLFLLLMSHEIKTKKDLEVLMNVLALSGVLLEVVSLVFVAVYGYLPGTRLQVLDVNENALGMNLLISVSGVFWWAIRPSKPSGFIKKILAGIFLLTAIALTGLSGSRGSAISWGITLLAFLAWKETRPWGIVALVLVVLTIFVAPSIFLTTIERFSSVSRDPLLGGREYLWPAGWQLIKDHLLVGVGIGNSPYQIIPYMLNNGTPFVSLSGEALHNPLMVVWAETGIPGLLLYLGVLINAAVTFTVGYLRTRKMGLTYLSVYFELVAAMFIGFMASWIKGGGMESSFSYFLVLSLLIIPNALKKSSFQE